MFDSFNVNWKSKQYHRDTLIWLKWGFVCVTTIAWCRNVSELKCCKICGAFYTCDHKGECCPECEHYDPLDNLCMAGHLKKKARPEDALEDLNEEIDPDTFLFEDDEEDDFDDDSDLPPERELEEEDEFLDDDWD